MSIQKKFIIAILGLILTFSLFSAGITINQVMSDNQAQVDKDIQQVTSTVTGTLTVIDAIMSERVLNSMALLREKASLYGEPRLGEIVNVNGVDVPNLLLGNEPQANQFGLVDELTAIMSGTATLFVKSGSDYVRVSTNVMKNDQRAIGTKLSPNGKAIKQINNAKAYYGAVDILGSPFLTGYEPIVNKNGETIGIWYVGYSANLATLEDIITDKRVLNDGFVALRDSKGIIRLHSDHLSNEAISTILQEKNTDWALSIVPFPAWGYEIILGHSRAETRQIIAAQTSTLVIITIVIASIAVIVLICLVSTLVSKPLRNYVKAIEDIAQGDGDLTIRFDAKTNDEFGSMSQSLNILLDKIQSTISNVKTSSSALLTSSNELSNISTQSSESITHQAYETEQVATAVQQMSMSALSLAQSANDAENAAKEADTEAKASSTELAKIIDSITTQAQQMEHSVGIVNELSNASTEITGVLEVIQNIAEQTNLLALNAAIEAARAGEQGRGFAVVADEVRSLASRTQRSTEEIRAMIDRLQNGAQQASHAMDQNKRNSLQNVEATKKAGQSVNDVLDLVAKISEYNSVIASSVEEQKEVSSNISERVTTLHIAGSENTAHAQNTKASSDSLKDTIESMIEELHHYKV